MNQIIKYIILYFFILSSVFSVSQTIDFKLAEEYFSEGEYDKSIAYYQDLFEIDKMQTKIYPNYLEALFYTEGYDEALKVNKKLLKTYPYSYDYKVDKGIILLKSGEKEKSTKYFDKIINEIGSNSSDYNKCSNRFIKYDQYGWAEKTLIKGSEKLKSKTPFIYSLTNIYVRMNEKEKLQTHLLTGVLNGEINLSYAQNTLQRTLAIEDYDNLESELLQIIQNDPNSYDINEMLIWLYYQKKDFKGALIQAKAFDRKNKMGGRKVMEVGKISMKNKDYENAIIAFEYITTNYPESQYNLDAKKNTIFAKEEQVKKQFPIDTANVNSLITDYKDILELYGSNANNAELYRRMANLYAFYLHDISKSISILETLIKIPRANRQIVSRAKLDLGDIYILKEEPWESSLLYSQVEKDNKDTPIGHEAKLRNAKLSYYKGDFELAQAHLNILKLATSREIANNALDLSLLITDNIGLDTTTDAMAEYSKAELLIFQNKIDEGLILLDNMLTKFAGHSLMDEVYWKMANTNIQIGLYEEAIKYLQIINEQYSNDILVDNAIITMARLYEEKLNDKELAQELYKSIITNYSGSIYVDEARKRYRILRGDFDAKD